MSTQTQFGHTIFLDGFEAGSAAEKLRRLQFLKNGPEPAHFDEAWLQRLVMRHPSLLPVDQIEPAFNTLVPVCIELPMRSGSMDNLFVTPAGDLALVECKLWRNPEARREVVAQIIDYAKEMSTWTYEALQGAIGRTRSLDGSDEKATRKLYELVSAKGEIDEASFHDAVSQNLKRGRFLLLIVGDGIREGVEAMAEFLQQHAGFHFTLAFVEIALFETRGGYIAQPRVLARTTNIHRGIVTLHEGRIDIEPPRTAGPTTITQELYFKQLEEEYRGISQRLNTFTDDLATYGVSPAFGADSMILRWHSDDGRSWNLGTISSHGVLFTDVLGPQANNAGLFEPYQQYIEKLAALVPGARVKKSAGAALAVGHNGKTVTVNALLADETRKGGWVRAIADFQSAVAKTSHDD